MIKGTNIEENSLENYRRSLQESFLELLWRQWRALGIASHGPESLSPIDLEALILATAVAAAQDRRLWQGALQWFSRRREWVNESRLKRMAAPYSRTDEWLKRPLIDKDVWAETCAVLERSAPGRRAGGGDPRADRVLSPLRPRKPALLQLYLRGVFGVNARAELVLFLLAAGEGNSNQIARETHYDQKNVYVILERWAESGFVSREKRGKQNLYSPKPEGSLAMNVGSRNEFWRWDPFFRAFGRLLVAVHAKPWKNDPYLLSSLIRSLYGDIAPFARAAGIVLPDPQRFPGEDLFAPMAEALPEIPGNF